MRKLSDAFMEDLGVGALSPILDAAKCDNNLILEIRNDYIDIYYRGGCLLNLKRDKDGYKGTFDPKYLKSSDRKDIFAGLQTTGTISTVQEAKNWALNFYKLKFAMDKHFKEKEKLEKEFQQLVIRENNILRNANDTDYYIIDFEYQYGNDSRFDLVALRWDSTSTERKNPKNCQLAIIEMKYGDSKIDGRSGVIDHIRDVEEFLSDSSRVNDFKKEMLGIFKQKQDLGLIRFGKNGNTKIVSKLAEKIQFILLLAGHKPNDNKLKKTVNKIGEMKNAELRFATASFMGYALNNKNMLTLEQFKKSL